MSPDHQEKPRMEKYCRPRTRTINSVWRIVLTIALAIALPSLAGAQTASFTEIYNSGLLALGTGETLQLTIANNNNVPDPAIPALPASEESCTFVAQFLDANASPLQKQQQTLQPGQNFSFSVSGPQTVQARVDVSPGTSSGFADLIAAQCPVSTEIMNSSSGDPVQFPLLSGIGLPTEPRLCRSNCAIDCRASANDDKGRFQRCLNSCYARCKGRR